MIAVPVALLFAGIIAANWSSSHFGPDASIYNALLFVGLVMSVRDYLNLAWGKHRRRNMLLLILAGSAVSYVATKLLGAGPPDVVARIALASAVAFLFAETVDWFRYETLLGRPWRERAIVSSAFGSVIDSALFVWIAFGWSWGIVTAQAGAKFFGAFVWVYAINHYRERRFVAEPSLSGKTKVGLETT